MKKVFIYSSLILFIALVIASYGVYKIIYSLFFSWGGWIELLCAFVFVFSIIFFALFLVVLILFAHCPKKYIIRKGTTETISFRFNKVKKNADNEFPSQNHNPKMSSSKEP